MRGALPLGCGLKPRSVPKPGLFLSAPASWQLGCCRVTAALPRHSGAASSRIGASRRPSTGSASGARNPITTGLPVCDAAHAPHPPGVVVSGLAGELANPTCQRPGMTPKGKLRRSTIKRSMPPQLAASHSTVERSGPSRVVFMPTRRLPVPNTLQIPLERNRDVQRRWQQMLQRTAPPRRIPRVGLKDSRTRVRFDVPLNGSSIKPKS
jgi:hypothetical protein